MIRFALVPALLAGALLVGCDSTDDLQPEPASIEVLPLDIGREWVMELTSVSPRTGETTRVDPDTFRVAGDTLIDGERWTRITATTPLGRACFAGLFAYREDGLYRWPNGFERPHLYVPYPESGTGAVALFDSSHVVIPEETEAVTVPAGTLQAYDLTKRWDRIVFSDEAWGGTFPLAQPGQHQRFLAPDLGPVYLESGFLGPRDENEQYTITPHFFWRLVSTTAG